MLKITVMETQTENRWILQGQLLGPWVQELRSLSKKKRREHKGQRWVLDLNDVTFIDKSGETLLRSIHKKGAELVASGLYTKHLLEKLKTKRRPGVRKLPVLLFAGLLISPTIAPDCLQVGPSSGRTTHNSTSVGNPPQTATI